MNWALCSYALLVQKKKKKGQSNGESSQEFGLNLWPLACSSDPAITLIRGDSIMFRVVDAEAGSQGSKLLPVLKI